MTEMITGVDLIQEQIKVAMGERLTFTQEDIQFKVLEGGGDGCVWACGVGGGPWDRGGWVGGCKDCYRVG